MRRVAILVAVLLCVQSGLYVQAGSHGKTGLHAQTGTHVQAELHMQTGIHAQLGLHLHTVQAGDVKFVDLPGHWGENYMLKAVENGIMQGIGGGRIAPGDAVTRAELAAIVNRSFGAVELADISKFVDVPEDEWYAEELAKAAKMGTIFGVTESTALPQGKVTREQAFTILGRAFDLSLEDTSCLQRFSDVDRIGDYAKKSMSAMVAFGYAQGDLGRINPDGQMTRAELATIMCRLVGTYLNQDKGELQGEVISGTVMVNVPEFKLKDVVIQGDLIIGDGCAGKVELDNCTINGRVLVRGKAEVDTKACVIHGGVTKI